MSVFIPLCDRSEIRSAEKEHIKETLQKWGYFVESETVLPSPVVQDDSVFIPSIYWLLPDAGEDALIL